MGPYRQALAPTCRGGVETNMNSKRKKPGDEHAGQEQAVAQEMDKVTEERMAELLGITLRALQTRRQRIIVDRQPADRTKTKYHRVVLLNDRALNAIRQAQRLTDLRRMASKSAYPTSPFVFQPSKGGLWINEPSVTIRHFKSALKALDIRERRQYDTRHTYATMCLMAGMNRSVHREPARP
ncbi:hypothetical protein LOY46_14220 [Pseudomonas sichuanensis]|nr:hypothetical protein LOY46_14220 [Pseudomonas sichuanensis]